MSGPRSSIKTETNVLPVDGENAGGPVPAVTELVFRTNNELINYNGELFNSTAWLLEQFGKKGPEVTDTAATFFTIMVAVNPTLLSSVVQLGSYAGLMYLEAIANVVEAKRLWDLEDHNVATNNLKIAIHAFDALQIAFFAYNPLLTLAAGPASFTLSILCEIIRTGIECLHAMNQVDFSSWFDDQIKALNYFEEKIKVVERKIKLDKEAQGEAGHALDNEQLIQQQEETIKNQEELNRLSNKRNDIYFGIEARRRAYLANLAKEQSEPTESTRFIESKDSTKLSLEEKLQAFSKEKAMSITGFSEWLEKAIQELNNVDNFLAVLANENCSLIRCIDATVTLKEIPIGTIFIKVNQDDESKLIVYWSENNEIVEKNFAKPNFFNELPTPNTDSTDVDLCAQLTSLSGYSNSIAPERIEKLVTRRNHLLLDLERRCDSYKLEINKENKSVNEIDLSDEIKTKITLIHNPFSVHYNDSQANANIVAAPSAKEVEFNKEFGAISTQANASDIERYRVIQARAEAQYQLQVDRFWIEVGTGTLMTLLVLSAAGISLACPVLAPAVSFIAVFGCYYLYKASQKYCLDREQNIPPVLRCQEPLKSVSSYLPSISSLSPNCLKLTREQQENPITSRSHSDESSNSFAMKSTSNQSSLSLLSDLPSSGDIPHNTVI